MSVFEQVGPTVGFGDVLIDEASAERFRKTALQGTKINELLVSDDFTQLKTSSYAGGVLSDAFGDLNTADTAFYTKNFYGANPDFWRSIVTFARFKKDYADIKIYNRYEVEAHAGEVVAATRQVRVLRNLSRIAFNNEGEPYEDVYSEQRKMFETPMQHQDVKLVGMKMERIMNRQRVTTKKKE